MNRRYELDSLRGLAALSVLLYHALATNSSTLTDGLALLPVDGVLANILVYSPLHVLWLGGESVWLFFVLSGFVLARAAMRDEFSLTAYYPSRMVRLYLPTIAAVALAWITYLVPHVLTPEMDQLLPTSYPVSAVLSDVTLLGGTSTSLGVLWSLQWEVVFSLLLPVYLLLARRRPFIASAVGFVLLVLGWTFGNPATSFLPMFFLGVMLAVNWSIVTKATGFLSAGGWRTHVAGAAMAMVGVLGLTSYFLLGPSLQLAGLPARTITVPLALAGIALIMIVVQQWPPLRRLLSIRPLVFLGKISFSLYLVHLPLVVLFAFVLPLGPATIAVSVVAAFAVAIAFYYAVEKPSHRLARLVGARVRDRRSEAVALASLPHEASTTAEPSVSQR